MSYCVDSREGPQLAQSPMTDVDARLWHSWLRINRVLRVMLHTRWNAEGWSVVRIEFRRALALMLFAPKARKQARYDT